MTCPRCDDIGWVCENHPDRPWEGERACQCGGAGAPCADCNKTKPVRHAAGLQGRGRQKGLAQLTAKGWDRATWDL
jgi:hypothetical protein